MINPPTFPSQHRTGSRPLFGARVFGQCIPRVISAFVAVSILAFCSVTFTPVAFAQTDALNFTSLGSGSNFLQGSYSLGWRFTANQDLTVTALGFYDSGKDGLANSHEVGIYSFSSCELLASTVVIPSDPLSGFFRFQDIDPVTLPGGQDYYIAAVTAGSDPYAISVTQLQVDPRITFIGFSVFGNTQTTSSLECPNGSQSPGFNGDFGPSFQIDGRGTNLVTPKTVLTDPPVVSVVDRAVTLTFVDFDGVGKAGSTSNRTALRIDGANLNELELRKGKNEPKKKFEFEAEIKRVTDEAGSPVKSNKMRKTSKRNELTFSNLKPGNYTASYRVNITTGKGDDKVVVGKTKSSPSAGFTIF